MKTRLIIGYSMAILGWAIIFWNAFAYLSQFNMIKINIGIGLILAAVGSFLIKKGNEKRRTS